MQPSTPPPSAAPTTLRGLADAVRNTIVSNVRSAIVMAAIGAAVGYVANVVLIAGFFGGSNAPLGSPVTSNNNTLTGGLTWGIAMMVVFSLVGYRRAVGAEGFWRDVRSLPTTFKALLSNDGQAARSHVLWGVAAGLIGNLFAGPWLGAVMGVGLLLAVPSVLGPIVGGLVQQVWRALAQRARPDGAQAHDRPLAALVGLAGAAFALVLGSSVPGDGVQLTLAAAAGAAAYALSRRSGGAVGGPPMVVFVIGAAGMFFVMAPTSPALADDGDFAECQVTLSGVLTGQDTSEWLRCGGATGVLIDAIKGAVAAGAGAAGGNAIGDLLGRVRKELEAISRREPAGPPGPTGPPPMVVALTPGVPGPGSDWPTPEPHVLPDPLPSVDGLPEGWRMFPPETLPDPLPPAENPLPPETLPDPLPPADDPLPELPENWEQYIPPSEPHRSRPLGQWGTPPLGYPMGPTEIPDLGPGSDSPGHGRTDTGPDEAGPDQAGATERAVIDERVISGDDAHRRLWEALHPGTAYNPKVPIPWPTSLPPGVTGIGASPRTLPDGSVVIDTDQPVAVVEEWAHPADPPTTHRLDPPGGEFDPVKLAEDLARLGATPKTFTGADGRTHVEVPENLPANWAGGAFGTESIDGRTVIDPRRPVVALTWPNPASSELVDDLASAARDLVDRAGEAAGSMAGDARKAAEDLLKQVKGRVGQAIVNREVAEAERVFKKGEDDYRAEQARERLITAEAESKRANDQFDARARELENLLETAKKQKGIDKNLDREIAEVRELMEAARARAGKLSSKVTTVQNELSELQGGAGGTGPAGSSSKGSEQ